MEARKAWRRSPDGQGRFGRRWLDGIPARAQPLKPDLVIRALADVPAYVIPGASVSAADAVVNKPARKGGSSTAAYFLLGGDRRQHIGERPVPARPVAAESAADVVLAVPATIADEAYGFVACADVEEDVDEDDEKNPCPTVARDVVIDTTRPPTPALDAHPRNPSAESDARFEFSDAEPGVGFACRVDDEPVAECASPAARTGLEESTHRFEVVARDAASNESAFCSRCSPRPAGSSHTRLTGQRPLPRWAGVSSQGSKLQRDRHPGWS
jgi:hypothetical protein